MAESPIVVYVVELSKTLGSAFSESFKGIIKGTMSVQDAFRNMFMKIADHFLDMAARMAAAQISKGILRMFTGGLGNYQLTGGAGRDKFSINTGTGRDVITDYTSGEDKIKLLGGLTESDLTIREVGADMRIKYEGDLMAIVQNTVADDLTFI